MIFKGYIQQRYFLKLVFHLTSISMIIEINEKQEGCLRCQTPTSTVRLKVEGCRLKIISKVVYNETSSLW